MRWWLVGLCWLSLVGPVGAATRLGLHYTQEEVQIWRQRAVSGPYRVAGDVSTNSPGDWTRIVADKNAFMANLGSTSAPYFWTGPADYGRCYLPSDPDLTPGGGTFGPIGEPVMRAAFWALIQDDATVRTAVRDNLLAQAAVPTLQFTNTARWCPAAANDVGRFWEHGIWLLRLLYAYDYIRSSLSAGHRSTLDAWFLGAADFNQGWTSFQFDDIWVNPDGGNYTLTSAGWCTSGARVTYFGGPTIFDGPGYINNRKSYAIHFYASVGIMLNNATLKSLAKRRFEEYMQYGVWPQGAAVDFERWQTGPPTQGWRYAGATLLSYAGIADIFGRAGDPSLLTYQTTGTETMCSGAGSTAGVKSLQSWVTQYGQYVQDPGPFNRFGTNTPAEQTAPFHLDSVDQVDGQASIRDTYAAPVVNLYYQNTTIKNLYLRQAANTPAYPASPEGGDYYVWGGSIYPGILFQWGQMEGLVNPYSTTDPLVVTITTPVTTPTMTTSSPTLTTLAGTASDNGTVVSVAWACPTCTPPSGTALNTLSWSAGPMGLALGANVLTVTATDNESNTATDTLTVTRQNPDLTSNLELHLRLNDSAGNSAVDATGHGHTATLSGHSWVAGRIGSGAVAFNGTTGQGEVSGLLTSPTAVTLAAWVKVNAYTPSGHEVLSLGDHVAIRVQASTLHGFFYTGTIWPMLSVAASLGTTWHHVAFVVQAGSQTLYLDGQPIGTSTQASAISWAGLGSTTFLGRHGNGDPSFFLNGSLDDVRVYTRPLTDIDIAGLAATAESPPTVTITHPVTTATYASALTPLPLVAGTATDDVGVSRVTWSCPTCTPVSGTALGTLDWSLASLGLAVGSNTLTVTATDGEGLTGTDTLTMTYTPPPAPVHLRLVPAVSLGGVAR